jgi:hypothetical protein
MHASSSFWNGINAEEEDRIGGRGSFESFKDHPDEIFILSSTNFLRFKEIIESRVPYWGGGSFESFKDHPDEIFILSSLSTNFLRFKEIIESRVPNGPTRGLGFFLIRTMLSHMQLTADGEHVSILSSPGFPTGRGRIQATAYWRARRHEILVS